jgi:diguanylate cyclase (GGDEF)-like protein
MQRQENEFDTLPRHSKRTNVFIALTLAIALIDGLFVYFNYHFTNKAFHSELNKQLLNYEKVFQAQLTNTTDNLRFIASLFAHKPEIQDLFMLGKKAVLAEGGGPGGDKAAKIRNLLYQEVSPEWTQAMSSLHARQLHFHIGPGSLSFLRVHKPKKFGDRMDKLRHIIVDSNEHRSALTGFETGRVYSGLRGVVPVFATDPQTQEKLHVGALEAGTSFNKILDAIDEKFGVGAAVLLTREHITSTVWPEFLEKRLNKISPRCGCVLEATSRPGINQLIETVVEQTGRLEPRLQLRFFEQAERNFVLYVIPLRDYLGQIRPERKNVGATILWRDITSEIRDYNTEQLFNIVYAISAFIVIEILLFLGFRLATRHLHQQIDTATGKLQQTNRQLIALLENTHDAYISVDADDRVRYFNKASEDLWQVKRHQVMNKNLWDALPEMASFFYKAFRDAKSSGKAKHIDGFYPPLDKHLKLDLYPWNEGLWTFFQDVTDSKDKEAELIRLATTDPLTGIYNRSKFNELMLAELERAKRYGSEFSVIIFDIDHFKEVNDTFGHGVGDAVIIELVKRIRLTLRGLDSFSRWGGEEFVVLMPETPVKAAMKKAEQFRRLVADAKFEHGQHVTISLGVTAVREDDTFDSVFTRADNCLYTAKSNGRNRVEQG